MDNKIETCECENLMKTDNHRTHVDGTFYQLPKLPVVMHDSRGCVYLDKEQYDLCVRVGEISESLGGKAPKINIRKGISNIRGYMVCPLADAKKCPKYTGRK